MAMIDYGAIAFKNGKLISTDFFTPMIDMVGWEDTENDVYHNYDKDKDEPLNLNGNYFAYVGDSYCTLAFYKEQMVIVQKYNDGTFSYDHEYFNCTNYVWSRWEHYVIDRTICNFVKIIVTKRNGYLVCRWKYKGDKYKVYFGYGVDLDCYKKWRMVNYYRSPKYRWYEIKRWIKDRIYEWKYYR